MNKELLKQAFEAGRTWQIAETNEYYGGDENEKPNFKEWYENILDKNPKEEVSLTLKFIVEEKTNHCRGCWGGNPATDKCYFLLNKIGECHSYMRESGKGIIYKLIR